MKATARIVAVADGTGGTRLAVLAGEAPLLPRRTGPRRTPAAGTGAPGALAEAVEVHLVGGAAGPLRGDDLRIEVEVGPGANLCLRTIAASIVLGGRSPAPGSSRLGRALTEPGSSRLGRALTEPGSSRLGRALTSPSRMVVTASVAAGGRLAWLPEPIVATARCDHRATSDVELAAGAYLTWREELVCGRSGEEPGDLRLATTVRLEGRALSCQELAVGPSAPGWAGPAVLGGHRAAGSLLLVDPAGPPSTIATPAPGGARSARLSLAGPAVLVTAVAPDAYQLRRALGS